MTESIWKTNINIKKFPKLDSNIEVDIAIIGGGMAGLLTAFFLEKENVDYVLLEGKSIAEGTTCNTTAKITAQHGLIYSDIINKYGINHAKQYLSANLKALDRYKFLCAKIDCDFELKDSYLYSKTDKSKLLNEIESLKVLEYEAEYVKEIPLPFENVGAVKFKSQAQFNPMKFINNISNKLNIFENTFVEKICNQTIYANGYTVKAKKIIITTHFPFINRHGNYFLKMYQNRSYCIAFEDGVNLNGMYMDEDKKGFSFRNYGNYLIVGGSSHKTGCNGKNINNLRSFINEKYPNSKEKFAWAAQDCITLDSIPYIGNYSALTPDLFVATGFNKWGMTSSMVAAELLCDLILNKKNENEKLFSPSRTIFHPQLIMNILESGKNLLKFKKPRCSHLGCALNWNAAEHTWDCPCHGSRFDNNGNVLENPATKNIQP